MASDFVRSAVAEEEMAPLEDPYRVLGVPRDAPLDKIRAKYWKLQKKYHPDATPNDGDAEMLEYANRMSAEINAAWEVLSDPDRRGQYDKEHEAPVLVVYDIVSEVDIKEGTPAIVRFKVDNKGGPIPSDGRLTFSPIGGWMQLKPVTIRSLLDDVEFPMQIELLIETNALATDIWHEGEIEVRIVVE